MRDISKRVVVNTVLASGGNVTTMTGTLKALKDAGVPILPIFDTASSAAVKTAYQAEIPASGVAGIKADGTLFTAADSTKYTIELVNAEKKESNQKSQPKKFSYTSGVSATRASIVAALVAKINSYAGVKVTASSASKITFTGVTAAPIVGSWAYQGASLAAATWKGFVIGVITPEAGWANAGAGIIVGAEGGSGSLATNAAIKTEAGDACTGTTLVKTADAGVACIDDGNYYTGEFQQGEYAMLVSGAFVSGSTVYSISNAAQYQIGSGAHLLANLSVYSRGGRDLFAGKHDGVIDAGVPLSDKNYDYVLMTLYESVPDQNQAVPKIPKFYEIYIENSNSTNVTNLVSALNS